MATQPMATVARIDPATWKPIRKAVTLPTWAWDNNAFAGWFGLEEMISTPQFDASKYTSTYDIAGKKYGILKAQLPPVTPNIDVAQGATETMTWPKDNNFANLGNISSAATATDQSIMNQLTKMQEDARLKAEEYKAQRDAAIKGSEWALDTSKIDAAYNVYKAQQDERIKDYTNNQTELAKINAQMQRDLLAIGNSPQLGAIARGQAVLKQQQYMPRVTMLQANTALLNDNITGAQNEWNIYYKKEDDNRTNLLNHYSKLTEMADSGYLKLNDNERETMNAQVALLQDIGVKEQAQKDKLLALMEKNPVWFAKANILPTDTYEQALRKMTKAWVLTTDSDLAIIKWLITKYPDAGILPTDNFTVAANKVKGSSLYQKDISTGDKWSIQYDEYGEPFRFNASTGQVIKWASTITDEIGSLSRKYESGWNPWAIWYDSTGGYSYGTYQLAHNNAQRYIEQSEYANQFAWLTFNSKEWQDKWKEIAKKDPEWFSASQKKFIEETHYLPQLNKLQESWINVSNLSNVMKDVIWSTAVQHGGNTDVIAKAYNTLEASWKEINDVNLINQIYDERKTRFGSSTPAVRNSVMNRMENERKDALSQVAAWLDQPMDKDLFRWIQTSLKPFVSKLSVAAQKSFQNDVNRYMRDGDEESLKKTFLSTATATMDTEAKRKTLGKENGIKSITQIQTLLDQYSDNPEIMNFVDGVSIPTGNDAKSTSLWKGIYENLNQKVGRTSDPEIAKIKSRIVQAMVAYRSAVSGAAFTESEAAVYEWLFPSISNNQELNNALMWALVDGFYSDVSVAYDTMLWQWAYESLVPKPSFQWGQEQTVTPWQSNIGWWPSSFNWLNWTTKVLADTAIRAAFPKLSFLSQALEAWKKAFNYFKNY